MAFFAVEVLKPRLSAQAMGRHRPKEMLCGFRPVGALRRLREIASATIERCCSKGMDVWHSLDKSQEQRGRRKLRCVEDIDLMESLASVNVVLVLSILLALFRESDQRVHSSSESCGRWAVVGTGVPQRCRPQPRAGGVVDSR